MLRASRKRAPSARCSSPGAAVREFISALRVPEQNSMPTNFGGTSPIQQKTPDWRLAMDVIKLLKQDHEKVKKMLNQLEETTERAAKKREELFAEVQRDLKLHELVE